MKTKYIYIDVSNLIHRLFNITLRDTIIEEIGATYYNNLNTEEKNKIKLKYSSNIPDLLLKHKILNNLRTLGKRFDLDNSNFYLVFDSRAWRKDYIKNNNIDIDYKAGRNKDLADNVYKYIDWVFNNCIKLNYKRLKIDGLEADDIIALNVLNDKKNEHIVISNDQDFYQLMKNSNCKIFNPSKKELLNYSEEEANIQLNLKIMVGDNSDNIPKIAPELNADGRSLKIQFGEKTVYKVLKETNCDIDKTIDIFVEKIYKKQLKKNIVYSIEEISNKFHKRYKENQKIIDFNFLPKEYKYIVQKEVNKENNREIIPNENIYNFLKSEKLYQLSNYYITNKINNNLINTKKEKEEYKNKLNNIKNILKNINSIKNIKIYSELSSLIEKYLIDNDDLEILIKELAQDLNVKYPYDKNDKFIMKEIIKSNKENFTDLKKYKNLNNIELFSLLLIKLNKKEIFINYVIKYLNNELDNLFTENEFKTNLEKLSNLLNINYIESFSNRKLLEKIFKKEQNNFKKLYLSKLMSDKLVYIQFLFALDEKKLFDFIFENKFSNNHNQIDTTPMKVDASFIS